MQCFGTLLKHNLEDTIPVVVTGSDVIACIVGYAPDCLEN